MLNQYKLLIFLMSSIFCLIFIFLACSDSKKIDSQIEKISLEIKFDRFDLKFASVKNNEFQNFKNKYNYLFPSQFSDSVWLKRKNDTIQIMLQNEVNKIFPTLSKIEKESENIYKHLIYNFPSIKVPKFLTLINNVDYQNKVIFTDTIVLISLDTFLGSTNKIYHGIPNYIKYDMDISFLSSHIADKFLDRKINYPNERTFLSQMLYYGKKLYLKEKLLPLKNDTILIGYSKKDFTWAKENEIYIWKYFIEKELLYNTDSKLIRRFLDPAPFSKFYLEIDNQSPGKIGRWIGWQIVRSFMKKNPEVKIEDLIFKSSQELFIKSGYKPKL